VPLTFRSVKSPPVLSAKQQNYLSYIPCQRHHSGRRCQLHPQILLCHHHLILGHQAHLLLQRKTATPSCIGFDAPVSLHRKLTISQITGIKALCLLHLRCLRDAGVPDTGDGTNLQKATKTGCGQTALLQVARKIPLLLYEARAREKTWKIVEKMHLIVPQRPLATHLRPIWTLRKGNHAFSQTESLFPYVFLLYLRANIVDGSSDS
jgi:hypothetical protein